MDKNICQISLVNATSIWNTQEYCVFQIKQNFIDMKYITQKLDIIQLASISA